MMEEGDSLFGPEAYQRFDLMRQAARTRRCHTQMVIHPQGVGEHTFSALAILDLIAPDCRKEVWRALLYHDAPEAVTGDVPAPAKWVFSDLEKVLRSVEERIRHEYGIHCPIAAFEEEYIKYADIMELVWYGIEEYRMGNRAVAPMVRAALNALKHRGLEGVTMRAQQLTDYTRTVFESLGGWTHAEENPVHR
jgi:5'-deoxynucleotidase YfbR-like HD superfamily hydrolase